MKGVIFKAFEDFVTTNWGDEVYEQLLDNTQLTTDEPFVGPGTYPDADLLALVSTAIAKLGVPLEDALRAFGKHAFPLLAAGAKDLVDAHAHPKPFLAVVDSIIHMEVRKLYPDAETPRVLIEDVGPDKAVLRYESARGLCAVLVGLVEGAGDYFDSPVALSETKCTHRGDAHCEFDLEFTAVAV